MNKFQMQEQYRTPEKQLNKVEVSTPLNKEFKVMIIYMLRKLKRRMNEHSENFNKELENTKKKQS